MDALPPPVFPEAGVRLVVLFPRPVPQCLQPFELGQRLGQRVAIAVPAQGYLFGTIGADDQAASALQPAAEVEEEAILQAVLLPARVQIR